MPPPPVQLLRHALEVVLGIRVEVGMIPMQMIVEIGLEGKPQIAFRALVDGHHAHSPLTFRGFSIPIRPQEDRRCGDLPSVAPFSVIGTQDHFRHAR